jgi:hypothetical protein
LLYFSFFYFTSKALKIKDLFPSLTVLISCLINLNVIIPLRTNRLIFLMFQNQTKYISLILFTTLYSMMCPLDNLRDVQLFSSVTDLYRVNFVKLPKLQTSVILFYSTVHYYYCSTASVRTSHETQ